MHVLTSVGLKKENSQAIIYQSFKFESDVEKPKTKRKLNAVVVHQYLVSMQLLALSLCSTLRITHCINQEDQPICSCYCQDYHRADPLSAQCGSSVFHS